MIWHTNGPVDLGFIPDFFSEFDDRPAAVQLNENYQHGGGWRPQAKFKLHQQSKALEYPGDPPMRPIAWTALRDEYIFLYPHAYVAIVQADGSFEAGRVD